MRKKTNFRPILQKKKTFKASFPFFPALFSLDLVLLYCLFLIFFSFLICFHFLFFLFAYVSGFNVGEMCVFVSRPMKIAPFHRENGETQKRVVDFPRERDTFRNNMEKVEDFDEKVTTTTVNQRNRREFCV